MKNIWKIIPIVIACAITQSTTAFSKSLKISEKIKYYSIKGKTAGEFAVSMSKKGPFSLQHRKRAWATASRDMTYQLINQRIKGKCVMKNARVNLKITYTLPKLTTKRGISKRQRNKWRKMFNLLNKHERTHGLFYKQFAKKVQKSLRRMKPASSCRSLDRQAKAIVKQLGLEDKERNNRFDRRDQRNYRRMSMLYRGS